MVFRIALTLTILVTMVVEPGTAQQPLPPLPPPKEAPKGEPGLPAPPQTFGSFQPLKDPIPGMAFPMMRHFKFDFAANTPLDVLLPTPPKSGPLPIWNNEDLRKVAELAFGEPMAKDLDMKKGLETIAHTLAKIKHLNRDKTDGFMLALIENRADLRGLPVLMGDDCLTGEEQAKAFREMVNIVNSLLAQCKGGNAFPPPNQISSNGSVIGRAEQLWAPMGNINAAIQRGKLANVGFQISPANKDCLNHAMVAALMQILMPESEYYRLELAKFLGTVPHSEATKALVKLALYSPEEAVRTAAVDGLKTRREKDYTDALLQGFRYPLPAVAKRAAEALVKLERNDLLANLLDVLEKPDPRLPMTTKRDGKETIVVRELVKINHHRNCMLCHAPGNAGNIPDGVLTVAVPLPSEPLPKPSQGGYQSTPPASPDITVRLDTTYLRQDFSVMLPVEHAEPWPESQRFDFLVRTRVLTPSEAQAYEACCEPEEPGRLSPYHRATLYALRELTGRDAEPTAAAWRKLLKMPKQ